MCLFGNLVVQAQIDNVPNHSYSRDAGTYGVVTRGGTARSSGIGNATTALGGDMGVTTVNPAGLGYYRKSELNFTPVIGVIGAKGTYLGDELSISRGYFAINNLGGVINLPSGRDKGFRGGSFSIGMNRVNSYQNKATWSGVNSKNNFGDYLTQSAKGTHATDLQAQSSSGLIYDLNAIAYSTYLINPLNENFPADTTYHTYFESETVNQKAVLNTKGAMYNWYLAYGANFNDKFYLGFSANLMTIRRKEILEWSETPGRITGGNFVANADTLIDYTYSSTYKTTGTGFSLTGGLGWKVSKALRFGASITTPTWYTMKDEHSQWIDVNFVAYPFSNPPLQAKYSDSTLANVSKYNYRAPMRSSFGSAIFIGKKGFISGDVELVTYNTAKYSSKGKLTSTAFDAENMQIKNTYRTVLNYRAGAEFRIKKLLVRGGAGYLPDPTKGEDGEKRNALQFSAGFGLRGSHQFLDVTLVNSRVNSTYTAYTLKNNSQPSAAIKYSTYALVISAGVYF